MKLLSLEAFPVQNAANIVQPLGELTVLPRPRSWTEDICYTTSTLLLRKAL